MRESAHGFEIVDRTAEASSHSGDHSTLADPQHLSLPDQFASWLRMLANYESAVGAAEVPQQILMTESELGIWGATFEQITRDMQDWQGKSIAAFAAQIHRCHQITSRATPFVEWDALPAKERLKWNFLIRAAMNCIEYVYEFGDLHQYEIELGDKFRIELRSLPQE